MSMNTHEVHSNKVMTILDVSSNTTGDTFKKPAKEITFQVVITGTATVTLQGSNDNTNFVTLASTTADAGYAISDAWVYIRAVSSGMSGATAKVYVGY